MSILAPLFSLGLLLHAPALQDSADTLDAALQAEISEVFAAYDNLEGPGMSVAVYRQGKLAFARGFGLASVEHDVPNGPDTIFRIGSTSKQFTAACVVILALTDELSLEDDIRKHLEEMPDLGASIRILDLLHHTSGLRDYIDLATWMGRSVDGMSKAECVAAVARQRGLAFAPGSTYQYSNSNYLLLGEIVARVSGQSLAEFAEDNLFGPLGMGSTHFHDRYGHVVKGRALGYAPARSAELELELTKNDCVGDGGVFTSVRDLLRWDANFYDERLTGGLPFLESMLERGSLTDGSGLDYASGLMHATYGGLPLVMHGGSWVGYLAEFLRFPEQELSVVLLANRADLNPTQLCLKVADVVLREQLGDAPALVSRSAYPAPMPAPAHEPMEADKLSPDELAGFAGAYYSAELLTHWGIALEGSRLRLQPPLGPGRVLKQLGRDCFGDASSQVQFRWEGDVLSGLQLWMRDQGVFEFVLH